MLSKLLVLKDGEMSVLNKEFANYVIFLAYAIWLYMQFCNMALYVVVIIPILRPPCLILTAIMRAKIYII